MMRRGDRWSIGRGYSREGEPERSQGDPLSYFCFQFCKCGCNVLLISLYVFATCLRLLLSASNFCNYPLKNVESRRNLLLGFGGIYGLANVQLVLTDPITAPDNISDCAPATDIGHPDKAIRPLTCCPPPSTEKHPKRYILPQVSLLRVRKPAHKATPDYIKKYRQAINMMKSLDDNDPHSWKNQAKIHCAYCNNIYNQGMTNHPELQLQIHSSSLFYPFHRWYLYFYERILGKLINDTTFALPYWNWDHPDGMMLPTMYVDEADAETNPLFDIYRQPEHIPPAIVDLQYTGVDKTKSAEIVSANLKTMKQQMKVIDDTSSFFGTDPSPNKTSYGGGMENSIHNSVHLWTGNRKFVEWEDMGNFYSAAYDPIFYAHHSNIDRMWTIWKDLDPVHRDPISKDWLNASFVFYDENKELVRVYNQDCVNPKLMGYDYEKTEFSWENIVSTPLVNRSTFLAANPFKTENNMESPVKLDKIVKVLVKRPVTDRTKEEKKKAKEMLFLNGIRFESGGFVKFDVLINDIHDGSETNAAASEFVGTFLQMPHNRGKKKMFMTTGTVFGITDLLEEIEADGDEKVLVSIVPWLGTVNVTISEIKIMLVPIIM